MRAHISSVNNPQRGQFIHRFDFYIAESLLWCFWQRLHIIINPLQFTWAMKTKRQVNKIIHWTTLVTINITQPLTWFDVFWSQTTDRHSLAHRRVNLFDSLKLHNLWPWSTKLYKYSLCVCVLSHSAVSYSLWPHGLQEI